MTGSTGTHRVKAYLSAWFARPTLVRALKVGALVGTILILINQGDVIAHGGFPPIWKVLLTYMVPYAVSSWSSVAALGATSHTSQPPSPPEG